jgi:hypothetical protein
VTDAGGMAVEVDTHRVQNAVSSNYCTQCDGRNSGARRECRCSATAR